MEAGVCRDMYGGGRCRACGGKEVYRHMKGKEYVGVPMRVGAYRGVCWGVHRAMTYWTLFSSF